MLRSAQLSAAAFEVRGQVRIYRPDDQAWYQAGEAIRTEYVR